MITRGDRALQRQGRAVQRDWEQSIRNKPPAAGRMQAAGAAAQALQRWLAARLHLPAITLPRFDISLGMRPAAYRRAALAFAGASVTGIALAAGAITKGYLDHPPEFWSTRIAERTQSPIYDRDQTLIGSVGEAHGALSAEAARDYAFIPLRGELPATYLQGLLKMENQNYLAGGWHNICGLDIPATVTRWIRTAGAGGSTLSMQLARALRRPHWGNETSFLHKVWRKGLEIGASCRLHQMLTAQGDDYAALKLYASYAPTFQGNGTLRGIEAASRIVFDRAPQELSDAQQLILAAAARKPLTLLPAGATRVLCRTLYPRRDNPQYDLLAARAHPARAVQCQILHRAIYRAPEVLEGARLTRAMSELRGYQKNGVVPANPFQPIAAKRLVNLASRTASTMPNGLLASIRDEAEARAIAPGEPLTVTLDAVRQHAFETAMRTSLDKIQHSPAMRKMLCLPLAGGVVDAAGLANCGPGNPAATRADVLALKVDAVSGGIGSMYASSPLLLDAVQSIGSTAKWIVILAALAAGHRPDELRCPSAVRDGERYLRRVATPETGFAHCDGGQHLMSWERATAESDNLVYYGLAQGLGQRRLAAAATALGLDGEQPGLAYALSFGTFGATPRALVGASQALIAVAYGLQTSGPAPRALGNRRAAASPAIAAVKRMLPQQSQRDALRTLLEAPVQHAGGTLAYLKGHIAAGKTGTVQSAVLAPNGRHYNHGKWNITYQHRQRALNLFFIASPLPSVPLAQPDFGFGALLPAHLHLLSQAPR